MCQKNVGRLDAFLRIAAGIAVVSVGIIKKRPSLATIGACKIASGVTRYCPVYELMDVTTIGDEEFLEELGFSKDDVVAEYDEEEYDKENHQGCGCNHHGSEEDANYFGRDQRRHYIHRAIKRNQYLNRDII